MKNVCQFELPYLEHYVWNSILCLSSTGEVYQGVAVERVACGGINVTFQVSVVCGSNLPVTLANIACILCILAMILLALYHIRQFKYYKTTALSCGCVRAVNWC